MQPLLRYFSIFLAFTLVALGQAREPSIIVNPSNRAMLSSVDLGLLLVGKQQYWENGEQVVIVYIKGDVLCEQAIEEHTGMNMQRYKQHWKRAVFTGQGNMPRQLHSPEEAIDFVFKNPGAVAIIDPQESNLASVRIVPLTNMAYSGINKPEPVLVISKPEEKPLGY